MSLYKVQWEEDVRTVKAPGVSETQLKVCEHYYVADSFDAAWEAIADIRNDPEGRKQFRSIGDCCVGVTIVKSNG